MSADPDDLRDHLEPCPGQLGLFDFVPAICPTYSSALRRCIRANGHLGAHTDQHGGAFT